MNIYRSFKSGLSLMAVAAAAAVAPSCTDDIKFGDKFQEKAPGGTITVDSVFTNETYTRGFLSNIYTRQYYGLPFNGGATATSQSMYNGKMDALTDLYQLYWSNTNVFNNYYQGNLAPNFDGIFAYKNDGVWDCVRLVYQFLDNVDKCTALSPELRERFKAEAKCVLASRYYDLVMFFGGVPKVTTTLSPEDGNEYKRMSYEESVEFIVSLLDEAIEVLPWAYNGSTTDTSADLNRKRWSKAGAMGFKARLLTYAASPLYNNDKMFLDDGTLSGDDRLVVWYGNYDHARWERALKACEDFFAALDANGYYHLETAVDADGDGKLSVDEYRLAYRKGYIYTTSLEPLVQTSVRDYDNWGNGYYNWSNWVNIGRNSYLPTFEYMCMFPWNDGTAFDWEKDDVKINGGVNTFTGKPTPGKLFFEYLTGKEGAPTNPTRDPRLYENMVCNGMSEALDWTSAKPSGDEYEMWVGGQHVGQQTTGEGQMTSKYSTGFGVMKYQLGSNYQRQPLQWVALGLNEMYLLYAECLNECGRPDDAIAQVQVVRNRVGLKKTIKSGNTSLDLTNKDVLREEILRERACELGMSNARYFDMVRYMHTDWMTKPLHGLRIYRQLQSADGSIKDNNVPYIGVEKNAGAVHPYNFRYEVFKLYDRTLWRYQDDPNNEAVLKFLIHPLPLVEINKGYGLVQNPGWSVKK